VGAKGYKYLSLSSSMVIFSVTHFRQLAAPSLFSNVPPNHLALIPSNFLVLIGLERERREAREEKLQLGLNTW
jgi:hypothetical protein